MMKKDPTEEMVKCLILLFLIMVCLKVMMR